MIDGVAPRGKINQQRERRYKSLLFSVNDKKWDSNKITPGTKFMKSLKNELNIFKKELEELNVTKMHISDASEYGEGEHKMMKFIEEIEDNNSLKNICIYGLDADLIMLSLLKQQSKNINKECISIFLLRDNSFGEYAKQDTNSDIYFTYIKIKSLEIGICNEIRQINKDCCLTNREIITDYIFICFLLGNDFLEHVPSLVIKKNGLHFLLICYIKSITKNKQSLINLNYIKDELNWKKCINLKILKDLFYEIQNNENYFLTNILYTEKPIFKEYTTINDLKKSEENNEVKENNYIITKKNTKIIFNLKDVIEYNKKNYKERFYTYYGIYNDIETACMKYIEGLYWTFGYYNNHIHNNWNWFYKFDQTPFASDIFNYLRLNMNKIENDIENSKYLKLSDKFSPFKQLLMVLPKESLLKIIKELDENIEIKIKRIFNTNSLELNEIYPNKIFVDLINKEFLWQSKIFFSKIDDSFINLIF
jgi:5'-3' exonuclease